MTKEFYTEPSIRITNFLTDNLITTSGVTSVNDVINQVTNGKIKLGGQTVAEGTEIVTLSL